MRTHDSHAREWGWVANVTGGSVVRCRTLFLVRDLRYGRLRRLSTRQILGIVAQGYDFPDLDHVGALCGFQCAQCDRGIPRQATSFKFRRMRVLLHL